MDNGVDQEAVVNRTGDRPWQVPGILNWLVCRTNIILLTGTGVYLVVSLVSDINNSIGEYRYQEARVNSMQATLNVAVEQKRDKAHHHKLLQKQKDKLLEIENKCMKDNGRSHVPEQIERLPHVRIDLDCEERCGEAIENIQRWLD